MGNNMEKEIFEKELLMCRDLSKKNNGKCKWGECDKCGVIPLLYKLYQGKIYDKEDEVKGLKRSALQ
jgi:hypothetical protein